MNRYLMSCDDHDDDDGGIAGVCFQSRERSTLKNNAGEGGFTDDGERFCYGRKDTACVSIPWEDAFVDSTRGDGGKVLARPRYDVVVDSLLNRPIILRWRSGSQAG